MSETDVLLTNTLNKIERVTRSAKKLVVPVSGGSDSALTFALLNKVCPTKTIGIYVGSTLRSSEWFLSTGSIEIVEPQLVSTINYENEINRWAAFLSFSLKHGAWLVGSRTRTENVLGTYSLASRVATYLPILKIWKTDVMLLCNLLEVPTEITQSSRKADPDCGRPQEMAEIPLEIIDDYLKFLDGMSVSTLASDSQKQYLQNIIEANKFKGNLPIRH